MTTYYHGSRKPTEAYEGMCLTTDLAVAVAYSCGGTVYEVELPAGLAKVQVEGIDEASGECEADSSEYREELAAAGYDLVCYADQDKRGCYHDCIRLVSDKAVAGCQMFELELV